jgi:hypothetical protein
MDNTPYEEVPLEAPIEPEILGVTPEKKKMKKSTLIIIIVAAVLVLCCCLTVVIGGIWWVADSGMLGY